MRICFCVTNCVRQQRGNSERCASPHRALFTSTRKAALAPQPPLVDPPSCRPHMLLISIRQPSVSLPLSLSSCLSLSLCHTSLNAFMQSHLPRLPFARAASVYVCVCVYWCVLVCVLVCTGVCVAVLTLIGIKVWPAGLVLIASAPCHC